MSVALADVARARLQPDAGTHRDRPSLRLVATRPLAAGRFPFAVLVGAILASGLVVLLLLHTMAAQDAFRLDALQQRAAELADTEQQLALQEQQREAPATLAKRARALGMVPTGSIAFVKLHHHGKIVGVVRAAPAPPPPPAPSASPSPSPAAGGAQAGASPNADKPPAPTTATTTTGTSGPRHHAKPAQPRP